MQKQNFNNDFRLKNCLEIDPSIYIQSYGFKIKDSDPSPLTFIHPQYREYGEVSLEEAMLLTLDIFFANGRRVKLEN